MIVGGVVYVVVSVVGVDIYVLWLFCVWEVVDQLLLVVLLIFFVEGGVGFFVVVVGVNVVLLILWILWCQVVVVVQYLVQGGKLWGGGNMVDLVVNWVDWQLGCLCKISDVVVVCQNYCLMIVLLIEQLVIVFCVECFDGIIIVYVQFVCGCQCQQFGGELLWVQLVVGWIGDVVVVGIDVGQFGNLFCCYCVGDVWG